MRSFCVVTAALASLLSTSGPAAAQSTQPSERRRLLGAWELVSAQDRRPNGDVLDLFGEKPSGTLIYTPDGRVAVQIMRDPRPTSVDSMWTSDGRDLLPRASAKEIRDAYTGYDDLAHAARAENGEDFVGAETRARGEGHQVRQV